MSSRNQGVKGTQKMNHVLFSYLGLQDYQASWDLQKTAFQKKIEGVLESDLFILQQHNHVYTLGKNADDRNLLATERELDEEGIKVYQVERGGDITYHGPGQLIGYPILNLKTYGMHVGDYMRALEEMIIQLLSDYEIEGSRVQGRTGVWVKNEKICAMGIRVSHWITMHGFALNVNTDLHKFEHIIPCGIADRGVTSLQKLLGGQLRLEEVVEKIIKKFENIFQVKTEILSPAEIFQTVGDSAPIHQDLP
jgi:lipoyl(octanoyl) transferase